MKSHNFFKTMFFSATILFFLSCSKSSDTTTSSGSATNLTAGTSQISFDYSGSQSGSFNSSASLSKATKNSSLYNISAGQVNGTTPYNVLFLIDANTAVGTYKFSDVANKAKNLFFSFSTITWGFAAASSNSDDFTLIITKNDGSVVEGSFSGTLNASGQKVSVTNGKLAAKF